MAIAALVIVALGATGCGTSSKSTTKSAPAITKAEFLAKGNAICKKHRKQQDTARAALGKNPTKAQATTYVTSVLVPSIQTSLDELKALGAPSGDQAKVTSMLNLAQSDLTKIKSNPALVVTATKNPFTNFAKIAHPYGLRACAPNA